MNITNDEDSGNNGVWWALDNFAQHITVWRALDGSFYILGLDNGTWQTFQGAASPQHGYGEAADGTGSFTGGFIATLSNTAVFAPNRPLTGFLGSFDLGGTKSNILSTPSIGPSGISQSGLRFWSVYYFTGGFTFDPPNNLPNWGWSYSYDGQIWCNSISGTSGDINTAPPVISSSTITTTITVPTTTATTSTSISVSVTSSIKTVNTTVTSTSSTTTTAGITTGTSTTTTPGAYSIVFSTNSWLCGQTIQVSFTGPLQEEGHGGHQIEFVYYQYAPSTPNQLIPIFTDGGPGQPPLYASTDDTLTYQIQASEWSSVNFNIAPDIYVVVEDLTVPNNNSPIALLSKATGATASTCNGVYTSTTTTTGGILTTGQFSTTTTVETNVIPVTLTSVSTSFVVTVTSATSHVFGGVATEFTDTIQTRTSIENITSTFTSYTPNATSSYTFLVTPTVTLGGYAGPAFIPEGLAALLLIVIFAPLWTYVLRRKVSTKLGIGKSVIGKFFSQRHEVRKGSRRQQREQEEKENRKKKQENKNPDNFATQTASTISRITEKLTRH